MTTHILTGIALILGTVAGAFLRSRKKQPRHRINRIRSISQRTNFGGPQ